MTMPPTILSRLPLAIAALLCATSLSVAADGWTGLRGTDGAKRAGFLEGDLFSRVLFTCSDVAPGTIDLVFGGIAPGLPKDPDYTIAVSVDGVAFLQRGRLRANEMEGDNDVVVSAPFAKVAPMVEAMRKGRSLEISTPSGRFTLPLRGSGKALAILSGGCDG